jgi:nucleoside-diphosphate kinase
VNGATAMKLEPGACLQGRPDGSRVDLTTSPCQQATWKPSMGEASFLCRHTMPTERTFLAIKPDGVQRGLVGEIIGRFERKGFKLVGLKQLTPSRELAENHYAVHRERPFFAGLVDFITSGPVVAMVWEGDGVIAAARLMIGATKPLEALPGTIRGDLAVNIGRNVIHGSDGAETALQEIALWFAPTELSEWQPADQSWRSE